MTEEKYLEIVMGLIMNGGDAKSNSIEAIRAAKNGDFVEATKKLEDADQSLTEAHKSQTEMLTQEASGNSVTVSLLIVHAQDHLMNAITFRDLAEEVVELHRKISNN